MAEERFFPDWRTVEWLLKGIDPATLPAHFIAEIRFKVGERNYSISGDDIEDFKADRPMGVSDVYYLVDPLKLVRATCLKFEYVMGLALMLD